jgi:DNA-binding CsgD family transcriptional regulator
MNAKLMKKQCQSTFPAGIIEGIEGFWHDEEKWVMVEGTKMKFDAAPGKVQRLFANAFVKDRKSQEYMKRHGVTKFNEGFEWWFKCVVGAYDREPDFIDGKFTPDTFNNTCKDYDCVHCGRLCSISTGLKNYEVATIVALKGGFTEEQTATLLFISVPGLKSRIEHIKEKLGATNMASMIAKAVEFGI